MRYVTHGRRADIPRPNICECTILGQHGCVGSDVGDGGAEGTEVRVVRYVAKLLVRFRLDLGLMEKGGEEMMNLMNRVEGEDRMKVQESGESMREW